METERQKALRHIGPSDSSAKKLSRAISARRVKFQARSMSLMCLKMTCLHLVIDFQIFSSLAGLLDKTPYNITVTPLFDDRTGHGTEAPQVCVTLGGTLLLFTCFLMTLKKTNPNNKTV